MKKIMFLIGVLTIAISSCSGKVDKKPENRAKEYANHIRDNNDSELNEQTYVDEQFAVMVFNERISSVESNNSSSEKAAESVTLTQVAEIKTADDVEMDDSLEAAIRNVEAYIWEKNRLVDTVYFSDFIVLNDKLEVPKLEKEYEKRRLEDMVDYMVLADNIWKVRTNENKEIWKSKKTTAVPLRYVLKENNGREVFKGRMGKERNFMKEIEKDNKYVAKTKEDGRRNVLKMRSRGDKILIIEKQGKDKATTRIDRLL